MGMMKGDPLDRRAELRTDAALIARLQREATTVLIPIWLGRCLVLRPPEGRLVTAVMPTVATAPELVAAAEVTAFLGVLGETHYLMVSLPDEPPPPSHLPGAFEDLFSVGLHMDEAERALLAYAKGMAHWHREARFDGAHGVPTQAADSGFARVTPDGRKQFPRTDAAVMIRIEHDDAILLARQPQFPPGMYSTLAGFVEVGETLEECVRREAFEEVGLEVDQLRYLGSQPWPFPQSLMIGFCATARSRRIRLDPDELEAAQWVTRAELRRQSAEFFIPPKVSLAHHLIHDWLKARE